MDYKLISSTDSQAHIRFQGNFNNINITWDARIQTLKSILQTNPGPGIRQFIEITNIEHTVYSILIGLNIKTISKPEILKTIIMITNYKNLRIGRHEYGERYFYNNK